jgi:hypothetical protein
VEAALGRIARNRVVTNLSPDLCRRQHKLKRRVGGGDTMLSG